MKKSWAQLYIALFLIICLIPCVGMLLGGSQSAAANETLAAAPVLVRADGSLNSNVLQETSDYISDRFAFRQSAVTAYSAASAFLGASSSKDVILGKDGWLFYSDTLDDYLGRNLLSDREVFCIARSLRLVEEYVSNHGADFLFTVAPNKNSVYGEMMPDRFEVFSEETNLSRLESALAAQGVSFANPLGALKNSAETLYYKGDTHWNSKGAALAADTVLRALGKKDASGFFGAKFEQRATNPGDLYTMLYPTSRKPESDLTYCGELLFSHTSDFISADDITIETEASGRDGSLLMYRDSFGRSVYPYIAAEFGRAVFSRKTDYEPALLSEYGSDCLIIETAERNLPNLLGNAPIFPAPERAANAGGGLCDAVCVKLDRASPLKGFVKLSGALSDAPDADSPVFVSLGEKTYEATPIGAAEGLGFTLYVPEDALEDEGAVFFHQDGHLKKAEIEYCEEIE